MFDVASDLDAGLFSTGMTLNVSLRVPDGIVLASDSLATLMQQIAPKMNVQAKCGACGEPMEIKDVAVPPVSVPSSTWPYAQKMFPINGRFGLATWGSGFVNNRSIYNHILELSPKFPQELPGEDLFQKTSTFIATYFKDQLLLEWGKTNIDPALQPDTFFPLGFQFVGFSKDANGDPVAKTHGINIGKTPSVVDYSGLACACTGDPSVVKLLWPNGNTNANFPAFSLQDAIDYAKFLIRTTADFQRFSGKLPTVGGDIDVALITNHRGFKWIAQKELYRVLDREDKK